MAYKKANIDWNIVDKLLRKRVSGVNVAARLGIHENTLYQRCKKDLGVEFVAYAQKKKAEGADMIGEKQFDVGMDGNVSMLIWLGKQYLGQTDKADHTSDGKQIQPININVVKDENAEKYKTHLDKLAQLN